jgi:hypothetical protein
LTTDKSGGSVLAMERGFSRVAVPEEAAPPFEALHRSAAELAGRYDELTAQADAAAVRWEWATPTSGWRDVEPLRLERMGRSPGRRLAQPPGRWCEHEAIGLDGRDRVVCVRQYDATGEIWLQRFPLWGRDSVLVAGFRAPLEWRGGVLAARLESVVEVRLEAGVPVASARLLPPTGACSRERYRHQAGRLVYVEEDSCDAGGGLETVVKLIVYDQDGRVTGIDAVGPGGRRPVWRRDGALHAGRRSGARLAGGRFRRQICA